MSNFWFGNLQIGMMTDKGKIDDLFFLKFDGNCGGWKVREPKGKGLIMARINGKDYSIGELKLITNGE